MTYHTTRLTSLLEIGEESSFEFTVAVVVGLVRFEHLVEPLE
jgi:hypothetical protein